MCVPGPTALRERGGGQLLETGLPQGGRSVSAPRLLNVDLVWSPGGRRGSGPMGTVGGLAAGPGAVATMPASQVRSPGAACGSSLSGDLGVPGPQLSRGLLRASLPQPRGPCPPAPPARPRVPPSPAPHLSQGLCTAGPTHSVASFPAHPPDLSSGPLSWGPMSSTTPPSTPHSPDFTSKWDSAQRRVSPLCKDRGSVLPHDVIPGTQIHRGSVPAHAALPR